MAATASYYLADATNVFAALNDKDVERHAHMEVPIDKHKLWKYYSWLKVWDEECGELLDGTPHIEVFFEDLFNSNGINKEEIFRIHGMLGIQRDRTLLSLPQILDKKLKHPQTSVLQEELRRLIIHNNFRI